MSARASAVRPRAYPYSLLVLAFVLVLESCGGRVARPVPRTTPSDHLMTCIHIRAEYATNLERANDVNQEKKGQAGQNVGQFMLTGVLFLNLNDTEKKEIEALYARNQELRRMASEKNCEL